MNSPIWNIAMSLLPWIIICVWARILIPPFIEFVCMCIDGIKALIAKILDAKEQKEIDEQIKNAADIAIAEFERRKK